MGLIKKFINWRKRSKEDPIYEIEDWNEIVYDRDDLQIKDKGQRQEYVKGCLEQIAEALKNQPEDQKKLQLIHDRLKKTVGRLQELNEQNGVLLKEAMEMVEFNMNVIRSTRMSSGSSNYSSSAAEVEGMAPQHGVFDAKQ